MAVKNTIYFGVSEIMVANTSTTTVALDDDTYVYRISVTEDTAISFDTSNLDPDKTAQGSEWGYQILLEIYFGNTTKTVTFPNGVIWERGATPILNVANTRNFIRFEFIDGQIYGCYEGSATYSGSLV